MLGEILQTLWDSVSLFAKHRFPDLKSLCHLTSCSCRARTSSMTWYSCLLACEQCRDSSSVEPHGSSPSPNKQGSILPEHLACSWVEIGYSCVRSTSCFLSSIRKLKEEGVMEIDGSLGAMSSSWFKGKQVCCALSTDTD